MSVALAIWHVVPGWAWGGGTLAIVVLVALAFFAPKLFANIVESAFRLLALIPWSKWQTYAIVAAAAAPLVFLAWLQVHDQAIRDADAAHEVAAVKAAIAARVKLENDSRDAYLAQLGELQHWIDGQRAREQAKAAELAAAAAREAAARKRAEDELDKRRSENVNADTTRLYPRLPLGVVLQFNGGAAAANGGDEVAVAAAAAGAANGRSRGTDSGVSLDTYSRAVEGTQRALRACRAEADGWKRYHAEVIEPWIATAIEALNRCAPKGSSP